VGRRVDFFFLNVIIFYMGKEVHGMSKHGTRMSCVLQPTFECKCRKGWLMAEERLCANIALIFFY
jgi:hypothetical protein